MDIKKKVTISWSGGKDSAFALHKIVSSNNYELVNLHTVINTETRRVGLHGVHETFIEEQAKAIGLPLIKLYLPSSETTDAYKDIMIDFYERSAAQGIDAVVFGDIFLEDLKLYREELLLGTGLESLYPLWKLNSTELIKAFVAEGFKTLICSANAMYFDSSDTGRTIDDSFILNLPALVDPCGENGEFHTFVYDGPLFSTTIAYTLGEVVKRSYRYSKTLADGAVEELQSAFWFRDLQSASR
jgi:uncharacterized protein (TIGR00290 family)